MEVSGIRLNVCNNLHNFPQFIPICFSASFLLHISWSLQGEGRGPRRCLGDAGFVVCVFPLPSCGPLCSVSEHTVPNSSILQLHNELQQTDDNQKPWNTHWREGYKRRRASLTWGDALHELDVRLKTSGTGLVALAMDLVHVCSAPCTIVPLNTQLTFCGALWARKTDYHSIEVPVLTIFLWALYLCIPAALCWLSVHLDSYFHICHEKESDQGGSVCRNFHWSRKRSLPCTLKANGKGCCSVQNGHTPNLSKLPPTK